ncbi:GNAT family N-acetyltransferase [Bifidobacterium sp. ESL0704]|uniref:GNAT family N-acetyltransferase n=1 Tax=Bifidobacterium sp. ESL0704 TaxID=2983219 RepID=UPI0023F8093D|nr:GNAT family N-acetyltransferase [Bifidobacterium sp. ESL0704]WEV53311.1 GNAT family N-acetyltransferase [Bifidobacterium sp. ESL0704]
MIMEEHGRMEHVEQGDAGIGVVYSPMIWSDVEAITRQFDETWGHYALLGDNQKLSLLLSYHFVLHYIEPATRGEIAHKNGQFMGVVLSRVSGQPVMFGNVAQEMAKIDERLNSIPAGRKALMDTELGFEIERRMERQTGINDKAPAEVELFLVSSASRGQGVGGQLWSRTMEYFERAHEPMFYLHTDSDCDVSFYDRHGMKRIAEREEQRHPDDGRDRGMAPTKMFIYAGVPAKVKQTVS